MNNHRHNISRIDTRATHGWQVRITRKSNPCSKFFADRQNGGQEEALQAAMNWRDEQLKTSPKLAGRSIEESRKGIKTGVPGLMVGYEEGATGTFPYLNVSVRRHGKLTTRSVSIAKWGLRAALWKACVALATATIGDGNRMAIQREAQHLYSTAYPNIQAAVDRPNGPALATHVHGQAETLETA
ncbi:MAG: hypothetical protein SH809_09945 [Rhodothermales bacterium]|nr:hypothetical protein [Rhodothermales bacterium]